MKDVYQLIERIIEYIFRGIMFVLPWFFLPWISANADAENFSLALLLWLLLPLLLVLELIRRLLSARLEWRASPTDYFVLGLAVLTFVSGLFALDRFAAFWGAHDSLVEPVWLALSWAGLYFFLRLRAPGKERIIIYLRCFIYGLGFLMLASLLILSMWWLGLIGREGVLISQFISAIGSLQELGVLLALGNVIVLGQRRVMPDFLFPGRSGKLAPVFAGLSILLLILLNSALAWWTLFIGWSLVLLALILNQKEKKIPKEFYRPAGLLVLPLIFIILNCCYLDSAGINEYRFSRLELPPGPSLSLSGRVLLGRPLLGYGPENYSHAFSRLRPAEWNSEEFWNLRFNRSSSYLLDRLASAGALSVLAYILFVIFVFTLARRRIRREKEAKTRLQLSLWPAFLALLIVMQIALAANVRLLFLFWFFASIIVVESARQSRAKIIDLNQANNRFFFLGGISILVFAWLLLFAYSSRYYAAEVLYDGGRAPAERTEQAIRLAPGRYNYRLALARQYRGRYREALAPGSEAELLPYQGDINRAITQARQAVAGAPFSVSAYETLALVYRDLGRYSRDSLTLAAAALEQAQKLEPANPVIAAEIGRLYFALGDYSRAAANLQRAIGLKPGLFSARYDLARVLVEGGQHEAAIRELDSMLEESPSADIYFQLGRAYFGLRDFEQAGNYFRRALELEPLHANALYSLALVYIENGRTEEAINLLKRVQALNPDRADIGEKIRELGGE